VGSPGAALAPMYDPPFIPPRESPALIRFAQAFLPAIADLVGSVRDLEVPAEDLERLKGLGNGRAILAPNHPTGNDPIVMFWLSRLLKQPFNYLAAREVLVGLKGWVMNRVGTYSVIRGVADRESIRTTRRLLAELDRKVVIFPEGEIYEHNDHLLAFQSGVPQIGFWALEDLRKLGKKPELPIVPIAIKYRCSDSPRTAIETSLKDLEAALDLPLPGKMTAYQRLRRVGDRVLATLERHEGMTPREGEDLSERIPKVRRKVLERIAQAIETSLHENEPPADQLHLLYNDLRSWVGDLGDDFSDYDELLYRRRVEVAAPLFHDLQRLQNFIAVTGDYVGAEATAERFLDVLGRLEKEVFGQVKHRVPRIAMVRVGEPIALQDRFEAYGAGKRATVAEVTREMEARIREMLRQLSRDSTPIALEA
jgi:1-acyl-sn-glycerol-3-phosphate acyltransferase